MISDNDLIAGLHAWQLGTIVSVRRHGHGLNSATWMVTADRGVWIVKAVPATEAAQFNAGLAVAAHLEAAGLRAGAPRVTRMGDLSSAIADAQVAVLPFIAGQAIDPTNPSSRDGRSIPPTPASNSSGVRRSAGRTACSAVPRDQRA